MAETNPFFPRLFEPGFIGTMEVKNRIVMPPMGSAHATADGYVTDRMKDYYAARAKGGVGLVIVEVTTVDAATGMDMPGRLRADDDGCIPGLSQLASVIHKHGAKAALQLHHAGRVAKSSLTGRQPVAPSPVSMPGQEWAWAQPEAPRELTVAEIRGLVDKFAEAAVRARKAGFDAVDLHGQGLYLVAQFLSAASNKRQDQYGGDLNNRARFLLEIIQAIKESTGPDFPVIVRLTFWEFGVEGGFSFEECLQVCKMAEEAGADALRGFIMGWTIPEFSLMEEPPNSQAFFTDEIKKAVGIPVIAGSRISPEIGEMMLTEGRADFIAVGRGLITDPEWANKAAAGKTDEIVPCITCIRCINSVLSEANMQCSVNPAVGREREYEIKPTANPKRVLVVGGGPAGMEAARVAALRGHDVSLYDRGAVLGGQLLLAVVPPHKDNLKGLVEFLPHQLEKLQVKINLGTEVTPDLVEETKPDAVVVATGAMSLVPDIPGIERSSAFTAEQVLGGQEVGSRVVVIGGELVGCETADYLAEKGHKVTVTRRGPRMATKVGPGVREILLNRLEKNGAALLSGVSYEDVSDRGVTVTTSEGERRTIEADTVVLAAGAKPDSQLATALEGRVPELYVVGDCVEPRNIAEAMAEGYRVGLAL